MPDTTFATIAAWIEQALRAYGAYGLVALLVTVFGTPIAARVARRTGVMDIPDTFLKPHARPIPYLGGTAICLGWTVALLAAMRWSDLPIGKLVPILLGGIGMSIVGLLDDVRNLSPRVRLAVGAVIITSVLVTTGTGFQLVNSVMRPIGVFLPDVVSIPLSVALGVFVVLGACNSTNLIDGLDGLCTGVTAIISLGFFLLAAHLYHYNPAEQGHPVRLLLAIAIVGATIGFLPWNFNPAKIFMGDAGSVLLGFNCGILMLLFAEWGIVRWVVGALMIFALPIFDTALAMFRRWSGGRSIFEGDRSHFYDQLVQRGLSVKQAVLVCYGLTILYGTIGLCIMPLRTMYVILICVSVVILTAAAAWAAGMTRPEAPQRPAA